MLGVFSMISVGLVDRRVLIGPFDFEGPFTFWGEFRVYHVSLEVSSLEPDLVSYFESGRFSPDSVLHKLASQFVGCLCFVSSFDEFIESFLYCWEIGFVCDVG